jgi:HSP90 family molecular chaperone
MEDPISHTHFTAEGEVEFSSLLYIPQNPPQGLFDTTPELSHNGIKLYVKRVFITDKFDDLFPRYLKFLRGVVDAQDLSLNVSREILQQDKTIKIIRNKLVRKAIALFQKLAADEPEKFEEFYKKYGVNLKLGAHEDKHNKSRLAKLLRFYSSKTGKLASLDDYVSRFKEGQEQIYYLAGETLSQVSQSPLVEKLIKKGYEVLYMVDAIDEWTAQAIGKYDDKHQLTNVAKEGLKIDGLDSDKDKEKEVQAEFKPLTDFLKKHLQERISKAVISTNLVKTPAALASGSYGFTANMERLAKAQALSDPRQYQHMKSQRVLEINPKHPIVIELLRRVEANEADPELADLTNVLYDTASLHSGFSIEDPAAFAARIHKVLKLGLNLPEDAEPEVEEEEVKEKKVKKVKETKASKRSSDDDDDNDDDDDKVSDHSKKEKGRKTEREDDDDSDVHHHGHDEF